MDSTLAKTTDSRALRTHAFLAESLNRVRGWIAPLNIFGTRTPMFFVFPMSLDGACYVRLSEALGDDQPFYAFQIPSKERTPETATSVPDIARVLVAEFEQTYPKGDFILGGWSAGAVMALEMAQQLTTRGRPPALLISLDHAPFNTGVGISPFYPSFINDALRLYALWKRSRDEKWKRFIPSPWVAIGKKITSRVAKLLSHAHKNIRSGSAPPLGLSLIQTMIDDAKTPAMRDLLKKLYQQLVEYRPTEYCGPVLLFLSSEHAEFEYERKWNVFAQNLKVCYFLGRPRAPTVHESFIRGEYVDSFARTLRQEVDLVLQRRAGPFAPHDRTAGAMPGNTPLEKTAGEEDACGTPSCL